MKLKEFVNLYIIPENNIPLYNYDIAVINSSIGEKYWQQFLKVEDITENEIDQLPTLARLALAVTFLSHVRFQLIKNGQAAGVSMVPDPRRGEDKELTHLN